ncbi:MAG: 50S ribosomal protein L15 [Patescibacteria group bacterium]
MELNQLPSISHKSKRRLGQGHGSGRVKTAGRGTKGQKARYDIPLDFEGGALPLIKRLPFLRGKDRNKSIYAKPIVLDVASLNRLPQNTKVTIESLAKHQIVDKLAAETRGVKILGNGDVNVALVIQLPISKSAEEKVIKAGGRIEPVTTSVSVTA